MIEKYFSDSIKNVGTEEKVVYTAPFDIHNAFVTGLFISNTSDRNTWMEVYLYQEKNQTQITLTSAETPLPAGSTAAIASLGQRIQLTPGDAIYVKMGHDNVADIMVSVSEIVFSKEELAQMNYLSEERELEEREKQKLGII